MVGIPSIAGQTIEDLTLLGHDHDNEWYEVWANNLSADYFDSQGMYNVRNNLKSNNYPFVFYPDLFFGFSLWYYGSLLILASIII